MAVENLIANTEQALVNLIRYGLGSRGLAAVASKSVLSALPVASLPPGELRYVTSVGLYEYDPYSTATVDGDAVVAANLPSGKTSGRWLKVSTSWHYGASSTLLSSKATGYLKIIEAYSADDGPEASVERVFGKTPSVLVTFAGDDPKSHDMRPGTFYRDDLRFQLLIITSNLRGKAAATQGSPASGEDPGAYKIVGDLRRLLCGVSPDSGITDVERLEIGGARMEFEDVDRRLFVWTMDVTAKASFSIDDEDLVDAVVRIQPDLVDHLPAPAFDRANFVSSGLDLDEAPGPGLERTITAGVAVIGGSGVASEATAHTFAADSWTYRDLNSDGSLTFTAVAAAGDQLPTDPPLADGAMRVARTLTSSSAVLADVALCSFAIPLGSAWDVPE